MTADLRYPVGPFDWALRRLFHHPEVGVVTLDTHLQGYAWHSRHHVAHITSLRQREGWLVG